MKPRLWGTRRTGGNQWKDRVKQRLGQFENEELGKLNRIEDKILGGLDGIDGSEELGGPDRIRMRDWEDWMRLKVPSQGLCSKSQPWSPENRSSLPRSEGKKRILIFSNSRLGSLLITNTILLFTNTEGCYSSERGRRAPGSGLSTSWSPITTPQLMLRINKHQIAMLLIPIKKTRRWLLPTFAPAALPFWAWLLVPWPFNHQF